MISINVCLTCPGCTVRSTASWWSGKSPGSHVGPDSQGRAAIAGKPAGPGPDSEPSWSAGTEGWRRPTHLLKRRERGGNNDSASDHYSNPFCWNQHWSVYLSWRCYMCYTWCQGVHVQRILPCLCWGHPFHSWGTPTLNMQRWAKVNGHW